jgi:glycosyltransferase involved in cell wall biosynthesis
VLASDIPVHREVLADAARFVRLDAQAIASELQAAWDGKRGPSRAKRLAHAAKFTWERTTRQTLRVYEEALE